MPASNHGNVSLEIAKGLKVLQARIEAAKIPPSRLDERILIATWNIRQFGAKRRTQAAIHYIAEILSQFDLIGVVELRENLEDLQRVLQVLGPYWRAVYSDMVPDAGGNYERIAYVFDKRAIVFNGLASAAFNPRKKQGNEYPAVDWWRPPYVASFRSGLFDFVALTAHIRFDAKNGEKGRVGELTKVAEWVDRKHRSEFAEDRDLFVMGDFNIPGLEGPAFKAVTSKGLEIPKVLKEGAFGTNLARDKRYDQILHLPQYPESFINSGGVLDFYVDNHKPLFPRLDKDAFTYQLSDHLPLWVQVNTDIASRQLDQLIADRG